MVEKAINARIDFDEAKRKHADKPTAQNAARLQEARRYFEKARIEYYNLRTELDAFGAQGGLNLALEETGYRVPALGVEYQVKPHDTLAGIAARYGVPGGWRELWRLNRSLVRDNPHLIYPGEKLVVPGADAGGEIGR